ncbi:MAG: dTMP kinase [Acholeplasmatales bacterium]|nr:dTMP kinase [Acholeplasmatales bacterium]
MGCFITFEGGEGTGKTTIITYLNEYLTKKGYNVISTREPGGIEIAEQIRNIILDVKNTKMDYRTEALLYAASRTQHLAEKIIPALKEDKIVLCDRYLDSSLVYQGIARGLGIENVLKVNMFATEYMPNITFFIDVKPEICFKRIKDNNRAMDRLDLEKMDFHNMVYEGYKQIAKMYPERIVSIDGDRTIDEIIKDITKKIDELLGE